MQNAKCKVQSAEYYARSAERTEARSLTLQASLE